MTTPKKQELATKDNGTALAENDAFAMFEQMGGAGLENVSANELTLPQLKILQPTSPAVAEGKGRPGDIFNSMTEENYGNSMSYIPLFFFVTRIKFKGSELNSGIECSSRDGRHGSQKDEAHGGGNCLTCPLAQWQREPGGQDKGPECIEFKNILAIPLTYDSLADNPPGVIAGKRKAIVPINKFLTRASLLRVNGKPVPFFGSRWVLSTKQERNDKGIFFVPVFEKAEYIATRAELEYLHGQYMQMKKAQDTFVIHDNDSDETITQQTEY